MKLRTKIQQRFADADSLGHINNIHLQEYFDLGKMELYADILGDRIDWRGVNLVLVSIKTDMMRQTRLGDNIEVESWVESLGTKSMQVHQRLLNVDDGLPNAECHTVVVCFDFATQQAIPFPEEWRRLIELRQMRVSECRAGLHAMPSGSILEQPKAGQLKIEN